MDTVDYLFLGAITALGLQRLGELAYARHTARGLTAQGARFVRDDGMALILLTHSLLFAGALAEWFFYRPLALGWWSLIGLGLFAVGQFLRYWSMYALGPRWNTRVYVLPGPLVAAGPYRFIRHPIYLGVLLELAGFPLLFGLWRTLIIVALVHVVALARRIRKEERALGLA